MEHLKQMGYVMPVSTAGVASNWIIPTVLTSPSLAGLETALGNHFTNSTKRLHSVSGVALLGLLYTIIIFEINNN